MDRFGNSVVVILDPEFGDKLQDFGPDQPIWITMSPSNAPFVRAFWATHPRQSHLTGITGFRHDSEISEESRLLSQLDAIDLHHGRRSSPGPYTALIVIGTNLRPSLKERMIAFGFSAFEERPSGFVAIRS